jgi:hypothetical protein
MRTSRQLMILSEKGDSLEDVHPSWSSARSLSPPHRSWEEWPCPNEISDPFGGILLQDR